MAEERLSEIEDISIETSNTEKQREQQLYVFLCIIFLAIALGIIINMLNL